MNAAERDRLRVNLAIAIKQKEAEAAANSGPKPLIEYQTDPIGFLVDKLGIPRRTLVWSENPEYADHTWDGTPDPLVVICNAVAEGKNVVVKSATGTGKSFLAAGLALWFEACWYRARIGTYAPRESQLRDYMWAEMGKHWAVFRTMFPSAMMQDLALFMDGRNRDDKGREAWSAVGKAVQLKAGETVSTAAQGIHGADMMLFVEEAEGVMVPVFEALENTCTAPHNFMMVFGNPNSEVGMLHQLSLRPSWVSVRISALDHPNVVCDDASIVPGAVSRKSILERAEKYRLPKTVDGWYDLYSNEAHHTFQSRVRGIPPGQSKDALIKMQWIQDAQSKMRRLLNEYGALERMEAELVEQGYPYALGVDPSQSEDGDMAATAQFLGPYCVSLEAGPCPNAKHLGQQVARTAALLKVLPEHIGVDAIGIGASTANELNDLLPRHIQSLHSGGAALTRLAKAGESDKWIWDAGLFWNLRAQMYWQLAMDLQAGIIGLPDDLELTQELVSIEYDDTRPKTIVNPKDIIRERLGRSPNKADAVVYANWVRSRATPVETIMADASNRALGFRMAGNAMIPIDPLESGRDIPHGQESVEPYWR